MRRGGFLLAQHLLPLFLKQLIALESASTPFRRLLIILVDYLDVYVILYPFFNASVHLALFFVWKHNHFACELLDDLLGLRGIDLILFHVLLHTVLVLGEGDIVYAEEW